MNCALAVSMPITVSSILSSALCLGPGHWPDKPILLRLDSAHDACDNRDFLREQEQVDFLIKWDPRKQDPLAWADKVQAQKA